MQDKLKRFYHSVRMNYYRIDCNTLVMGGGLEHSERLRMDPRYRSSFTKYKESHDYLQEQKGGTEGRLPRLGNGG